jgi:poly-gamma-glutamate synthesis protein (capsule biosynthesis protein)
MDANFFRVMRHRAENLGVHRLAAHRAWPLTVLVIGLACATTHPPASTPTSTPSPGPGPGGAPIPSPGPVAGEVSRVRSLPAPPAGVETLARASVAAVGDVLMHGAVKDAAADHRAGGDDDGFGWLWAPVADLLSAADLTFANLETPIAPRSGQGSRSFVFNAPASVVTALKHAGVDVVSVANNHMFDQGRAGFEETLRELDRLGMPYVGAGEAGREAGPRLFQVNGLELAFLAYAYGYNQSGNDCPTAATRGDRPCLKASLLDPERAVAEVAAAARRADAVVVSVHWGIEYDRQPREEQVALAHRLADAGALVVLGHHPHVLQPVELYPRQDGRTALIAYSLGNFVSNQSRNYVHGVTPEKVAATRDGLLLRAELARRDYGHGVVRVELAGADWVPLWTENDTADPDRRVTHAG